jgi:hypothetical protein
VALLAYGDPPCIDVHFTPLVLVLTNPTLHTLRLSCHSPPPWLQNRTILEQLRLTRRKFTCQSEMGEASAFLLISRGGNDGGRRTRMELPAT